MDIGKKIKDLRVSQDLTQEELATRCELTKGFISQVERDMASPSISSFIDILSALGTNPSEFFTEENEQIVFKDEEFIEYEDEENKITINWLVPNSQKNLMEPTIIDIYPSGKTKIIYPFEGEEFGFVLEGEINLIYGDEILNVKSGESFYFEANKEHYIENSGNKMAKVIWITSPPNF